MSDSSTTPLAESVIIEVMSTPGARRFAGISVVVADMSASLEFYRACGLAVPDGVDDEPHVDIDIGGGLHLMFDTVETVTSFNPDWTPPSGGGRASNLAIECLDVADVDATHDALVAAGHRSQLAPFDAFWRQRYATVLDPDGNPVDLFHALD